MTPVPTSLFEFAFCQLVNKQDPSQNKTFQGYLAELADLADAEDWGVERPGKPFPVLSNYIHYTFARLAHEYNDGGTGRERDRKVSIRDDFACFNTGLYTEEFEQIFCLFQRNRVTDRQPWYLLGFVKESDRRLSRFSTFPERASYFTDASELVYDYHLDIRPNKRHILGDDENRKRLPAEYQAPEKYAQLSRLFDGAVEEAKKRVSANFRMAVPQYYNGRVQLLIPLALTGTSPELALAIERDGEVYQARTCLSLEMAYNNARLIAKLEEQWLRPS